MDKWLWHTRLFKTRSLATAACQAQAIKVSGQPVKPSREVQPGDIIEIDLDIPIRRVRVLSLPAHRLGAPLAALARENLTPPAPPRGRFDFLDHPARDRGAGRPTKKERRQQDRLLGP